MKTPEYIFRVPVRLTASFDTYVRADNEEEAVTAATSIYPIDLFITDENFVETEFDVYEDRGIKGLDPDEALEENSLWDEQGHSLHNYPTDLPVWNAYRCKILDEIIDMLFHDRFLDEDGEFDIYIYEAAFKYATQDTYNCVEDVLENMLRMQVLL